MLRPSLSGGGGTGAYLGHADVSPELMLRPSLSAAVALARDGPRPPPVSPELMLRPSLSVAERRPLDGRNVHVSPELMLRPSLSGAGRPCERLPGGPVSPELMLRPSLSGARPPGRARAQVCRVAGAYAPAFVERCKGRRAAWEPLAPPVSPELMLRPSLSAPSCGATADRHRTRCRRSLCSGLR